MNELETAKAELVESLQSLAKAMHSAPGIVQALISKGVDLEAYGYRLNENSVKVEDVEACISKVNDLVAELPKAE